MSIGTDSRLDVVLSLEIFGGTIWLASELLLLALDLPRPRFLHPLHRSKGAAFAAGVMAALVTFLLTVGMGWMGIVMQKPWVLVLATLYGGVLLVGVHVFARPRGAGVAPA